MKTKKTRKRKNPPTPAQLRARAKFARMSRARAAQAKKGRITAKKARPVRRTVKRAANAKISGFVIQFVREMVRDGRSWEEAKGLMKSAGFSDKDIAAAHGVYKQEVSGAGSKKLIERMSRQNPRRRNKTVIKAKTVKIKATNGRKRNALPLPATASSLKSQYDPKSLKAQRDRLRTNIQSYAALTRKLTGQLKSEKDSGRAQDLRRQLAEIDRLESREVSQLDRVLTMMGASKGVFKRRRNPVVTPKSKANFERFHGRPSRKTVNLVAPDGTPKSLSINGPLHKLITRKVTVPFYKVRKRNPGGMVFLAESDNGGLHIVAEGMGLPIGPPNTDFGAIEKVEYDMPDGKVHLGYNEPTGFVHKFGEDGGEKPHLETNDKGEYIITGGDYFITERGIENPRRRRKRRIYR